MKHTLAFFVVIALSLPLYSQDAADQNSDETPKAKPAVAESKDSEAVKLRPATTDTSKAQGGIPVDFNVRLPAGVLFGEFSEGDGPFLIEGSVVVPAGQTLSFAPGSIIYVGGDYSTITIFGQLICKGTAEKPIVFRSANPKPNPWDWDRIYVRSRNRTILKHVTVTHSNYGLFVENGSVTVDKSTFERNSLHGIVIKNADALIYNSVVRKGHVLGIFLQPGATVQAESLHVQDNITGVACDEMSSFTMTGGNISKNRNGIAIMKGAAVNIVAADITKNKIGVVSEQEIPKKMMTMVYGNIVPTKTVKGTEMATLLKPPESVKSVVLPKGETKIKVANSFEAGFSALQAPRETHTSFIGNVEVGAKYFYPRSHHHPKQDTLIAQTRYVGEHGQIGADGTLNRSLDREFLDGIQPEITVFAQGKRAGADVNLNADLYGNTWIDNTIPLKRNMFTFSMNYADQALLIGDSYENISETSMSGRKVTGIRFTGNFFEMGRGTKRLEFKLVGGQSEIPRDSGDHDIQIPGSEVDTGFSVRQQLTYVASLTFRPTHFSTVSARGIIAHDQNEKHLLGRVVTDPAAPKPISAATGVIDGSVVLFDGMMEVFAEVDMGVHDTVDSQEFDDLAWYNPHVSEAVPRVFGTIHPDSNNYAVTFGGQGKLKGVDLRLAFTEIANNYFSAGNPYLENDRRYVTLTGERMFMDGKLETSAGYKYERTSVSNELDIDDATPIDKNRIDLSGKYGFGEGLPIISAKYGVRFERSDEIEERTVDTTDTTRSTEEVQDEIREINQSLTLESRHRLNNGIDYSIKYRLMRDNDLTEYKSDPTENDEDDGWMNEISGRFGFNIKRRIRNRTNVSVRFKNENKDSLNSIGFKFSDNLRFTIIPRKLSVTGKGEYQRRQDDEIGTEDDALYIYKSGELEVRYSITSKLSISAMGRYEDVYDQNKGSENYDVFVGGLHVTYLF